MSDRASKGGKARAASMTPEQRSDSARKAVRARWAKARVLGPTVAITRHGGHVSVTIRQAFDPRPTVAVSAGMAEPGAA